MKTNLCMAVILLLCFSAGAQETEKRKFRFPVWLYTADKVDIYGLSVGVGSDLYQNSDYVGVRSNGIRIEPISESLLIATLIFGPDTVDYPLNASEHDAFLKKIPNEIINGLNLSCGTNAFANVNGITISAISQSLKDTNGISLAGLGSGSFRNNGIQIAGAGTSSLYSRGIIASCLNTDVYKGYGLQIGGFNKSVEFNGVQVGIFNNVMTPGEKFSGLQIGVFNNTKKLRGIQLGLLNKNEKRTLPLINWNFRD